MAIAENGGVDLGISVGSSSLSSVDSSASSSTSNDQDQSANNNSNQHVRSLIDDSISIQPLYMKVPVQSPANGKSQPPQLPHHHHHHHERSNGGDDLQRDIRELQELFSKLNPWAEEFVPPSLANNNHSHSNNYNVGLNNVLNVGFYANNNNNIDSSSFMFTNNASRNGQLDGNGAPRRKKNYNQGNRRMNSRTTMAQREDIIRRTVYVSDIDQQVTEEQLAALFVGCGQVVDCRICGDPNSVLRFAFIEFTDEESARAALNLAGTVLGYYPVRVLPSKTAIAPVNPTFLPRSDDEREMCTRTIYCTNIDKKVTQAEVKLFFQSVCGEVYRLRLLGDYHHSTRIAFVEFVMAESAIAALNCSGVVLGSLPIRVSPSKTPVRPRAPRLPMH